MGAEVYERHRLIETDEGPISLRESGQAGLPPVLLLHGAMYDESRLIWYHLAPSLARTRRVIAIDFPRHGGSRPWRGTAGVDCLLRVVGRTIDELGLPPLPLIGLSMGGGVAIAYALSRPERVTGLLLMGPGGLGKTVPYQFLSWAFTRIPGALTALTRYYGRLPGKKMRAMMASMLSGGESAPGLDDLTALIAEEAARKLECRERAIDDWQLEGLAPFRLRFDYLPDLGRLSCPSLWLRGEDDPLVGQRVMELAAEAAPRSRLITVAGAGHLLPLEKPEIVDAAVSAFLREWGI